MSEDLIRFAEKCVALRDISLSAAYPDAMVNLISQDHGNWLLVLRSFLL